MTQPSLRLVADGAMNFRAAAAGLPQRFEGVGYSGAVIPRLGLVVDLDSTEIGARLPLLSEHDHAAIIGVVLSATKRAGRLDVAGRIFSDIEGSAAERLAMLAQRGAPLQMSLGLYSFTEETVHPGQAVTVNGRTVAGPVTVLRRGVVRECSIVTLGADSATSARLFSSSGAKQAASLDARAIFAMRARRAAGIER